MHKIVCKIILLSASAAIMLSCAPTKWSNVSSSVDVEEIMAQKFPELNKKRAEGNIVVEKIEQRTDKNGKIIYRVTYGDRYNSNNDDDLLWQTVYMPVVNQ